MSNAGDDGVPTWARRDESPVWVPGDLNGDLQASGVSWAERLRTVTGAALAVVYLPDPETGELRIADAVGPPVERYGLPTAFSLSDRSAVAEAVRSNQPVWLDTTQLVSDSSGVRTGPERAVSLGVVPLVTVPLTADGVARGGLVVVQEGPAGFEDDQRTLVELFTEQLSAGMATGSGLALGRRVSKGHGPSAPMPYVRIGTFILDRNTGRIDADATLLELFDVAPGTFDGYMESLIARILLDDLPTFISTVGRSGATAEVRDLMFRARQHSGEPQWLHLRCRVLIDGTGRARRALGVIADALPVRPDRETVSGLQELSTALSVAATVNEVGRIVVDAIASRLGPDRVAFGELRGDRLAVSVLQPRSPGDWPEIWRGERRTEWLETLLPALPSLEAVLQAGRTSVWPADSALEPGMKGVGPGGLAVLPLSAEGRLAGVCLTGWNSPHQFSAEEWGWLSVVAGRAAEALVRAQRLDTAHEHARILQTSLLPRELPGRPGTVTAARYLPAAASPEAGGDWYDVITSEGHLALVIGDVQGHSPEAATIMGQVSTAIRAYSAEGHPPDVVFSRANRLLASMKTDLFATCCYVSVDIEEGNAWFVRAGHVPPLLRQPGGSVEVVDVEGGPPLGVLEVADFPLTMVEIAPGAVIALVTDGLVESANLDLDAGLRRLCDVLALADTSDVGGVADELIKGADRQDDITLLLFRYDGLKTQPVRASWTLWRLPESVMHARRFITRTLRSWGVSEETDTVQLIVSELVTNAVIHTQGDVRLDLMLAGDRLRVAVTDTLPRTPVKPTIVDWESTGGRGIMLVEAMSTAWGSLPVGVGKQVWSEIALTPRETPNANASAAQPAETQLPGI
ncbi:SpoIIE family protein phosphatase [Streptomyces griseorubiginosus]|uniref:SpoIIE family protein phosphatase n=1 Tax=Streptomyces griseorubiginosus TaxID=67304 RepID=UPI0036E090FC